MPEPGSHGYDIKRTRLRGEIDDQGTPDQHADEEANRRLRGDTPGPSPSMATERAGGPAGGDRAGGDPGNVIPLRCTAFTDHAPMADTYAKDGGNEAPRLEWSDVPDGTRELVLLCVDPDAPTGPFLHWLVTGIDPDVTSLDGASGVGVQHTNGYGEQGYGGPRPPVGDDPHRYVFRLYALGEPFAAPDTDDPEALRAWLDERALATGTIVGLYQR